MANLGTLYLLPVPLGDVEATQVLPNIVPQIVARIDEYVVENSKAARKHIKNILAEKKQADLVLFELNKHTSPEEISTFLQPLKEGRDMGLLSDAGCPGVADPGSVIVRLAHQNNIEVVPLVGPSSILLSMMASGMNGQSFTFHGYLPIDKKERKDFLKKIERISGELNQAQIFIETPYRNNTLIEDMLKILDAKTKLCIAVDITLPTQFIKTKSVADWKKQKLDIHKRPAIFIIQRD